MKTVIFLILWMFAYSVTAQSADEQHSLDLPISTDGDVPPQTHPDAEVDIAISPEPQVRTFSKEQSEAFHKLIKTSECAFSFPPSMSRSRVNPSIVKVAVPCGKDRRTVMTQCYGTIYCTNNISPFYIENGVCWSKDGNHCPTANECASSSFFDSARDNTGLNKAPILQEQSGVIE